MRPVCRGLVGGPIPNQLGVDCNADVIEAVLSHSPPSRWAGDSRNAANPRHAAAGWRPGRDVNGSARTSARDAIDPAASFDLLGLDGQPEPLLHAPASAPRTVCGCQRRTTISSMDAPSTRPSMPTSRVCLVPSRVLPERAGVAPTGPRGRRPRPLLADGATADSATAALSASIPRASRPAAVTAAGRRVRRRRCARA